MATNKNNIEETRILMEYADKHNIILELNSMCNGNYPLNTAITNNNNEIVELLIKYANKHDIDLEINKKAKQGFYPFFQLLLMKILI